MSIHKLNNIKDTTLWQILDSKFKNTAHEELASRLSANIVEICREAADKMKALPAIMPQYTLHDQVHLLRVTELMAMVGDSVCEKLNPAELALAILSANFHDHGMVLDGKEVAELNRDPAFRLFAENWKISNPSLREIERELTGSHSNEATKHVLSAKREELLRGMITDFVRQRHAAKSREYVNSSYSNDRRWEIHGVNFSRHVGVLCESHGRDAEWLNAANDCHYDWSIATLRVNVQYIGVLLRLADILDFDKDRTPDFLYRSIHFTNSVSLREWEKHRSIQGWVITPNLVRFTAECNHPVYERAVRQYMDWIDTELANSHALVRKFPTGIAEHYQLKVPMRVDRSHIKALNDCYRYHDLEFTLSRDELVELLMTTNLYKDPSLCVRELLQNALDALRHRQAIYRMNNQFAPEGSVELIHNIDSSGYEVLQCKDTGVGMDESIIEKFLTRVGRSYYRSPEFEQVRTSFQARGVDFDPCSRFGIGFMSCFMLGDRIRIHTRRDYGPGMAWGDPLVVEISGLGGLVVIRKGAPSQEIGTTVELTSRKKPTFFDMWEDQIRLIPVVREYARASEFTIRAKTTIDEIAGSIEVTPGPKRPKHPLQKSPIKKFTVIEQHFSEVDSRLDGSVVLALLIDGQGNPTFKTQEAKMAIINEHTHRQICYVEADGQKQVWKHKYQEGATCMDGILVSGGIERCEDEESMLLARYSNIIRLPENFILDIRGDIKPELTPARRPPDSADRSPRWSFIQKLGSSPNRVGSGQDWVEVEAAEVE